MGQIVLWLTIAVALVALYTHDEEHQKCNKRLHLTARKGGLNKDEVEDERN